MKIAQLRLRAKTVRTGRLDHKTSALTEHGLGLTASRSNENSRSTTTLTDLQQAADDCHAPSFTSGARPHTPTRTHRGHGRDRGWLRPFTDGGGVEATEHQAPLPGEPTELRGDQARKARVVDANAPLANPIGNRYVALMDDWGCCCIIGNPSRPLCEIKCYRWHPFCAAAKLASGLRGGHAESSSERQVTSVRRTASPGGEGVNPS